MEWILTCAMLSSLGGFYFWLKHRTEVQYKESEVEMARIEAFKAEALAEIAAKNPDAQERWRDGFHQGYENATKRLAAKNP